MQVKILYVEDELSLGKIVKHALTASGYDVFLESDGAKVVMAFNKFNPHICVLDVMLPNISGFDLAKQIKEINADVPIIFVTAKTQTTDVIEGFKLGANDYLKKPFSIEELIARVENILTIKKIGVAESIATEVVISTFTFNTDKQSLVAVGNEHKLSFKEAELLKLLVSNKNKIIKREDILNQIWGSDSFFNSRNLDVYITKIRSYFKTDDKIEILTIKGIGYRFVC
ncbi:MAG: response regulator transcription factor [Bacteroidetes bacterium]|nr:response regulator transcription factor [Bacteroidota bacterium]